MSDEETTPAPVDLNAIPGSENAPEAPDLSRIPVSEIKPENVATLTLEHRDGRPVLVLSNGTAIPADITVVDESGRHVSTYTAVPPPPIAAKGIKLADSYFVEPYTQLSEVNIQGQTYNLDNGVGQ